MTNDERDKCIYGQHGQARNKKGEQDLFFSPYLLLEREGLLACRSYDQRSSPSPFTVTVFLRRRRRRRCLLTHIQVFKMHIASRSVSPLFPLNPQSQVVESTSSLRCDFRFWAVSTLSFGLGSAASSSSSTSSFLCLLKRVCFVVFFFVLLKCPSVVVLQRVVPALQRRRVTPFYTLRAAQRRHLKQRKKYNRIDSF